MFEEGRRESLFISPKKRTQLCGKPSSDGTGINIKKKIILFKKREGETSLREKGLSPRGLSPRRKADRR